MPQEVGGAVVEDGVWMRRGPIRWSPALRSPAMWSPVSRSRHRVRDGQENIPRGSGWRWNSPLPEWYPRTPLRDISAILKALERRRLRMEAAAAQQRALGIDPESPPQLLFSSSPVPRDAIPSDQISPIQKLSPDVSNNVIDSAVVATTSTPQLTRKTFQIIPAPVSLSENSPHTPVDLPQKTTSIVTSLPAEDSKPSESGKKLLSSIDVIERAVREKLNRKPKGPSKKTIRTRTLMSMR